MPRPISWHSRLSEIHRRVKESARTPYTRGEIEKLFRIQAGAAKKLMQLMSRIEQGNATVVEREDLLGFLAAAIDAEDLSAHLAQLRKAPPRASRRTVRLFVPGNFQRGNMQPLTAHNIWLKRGRLEIDFRTFDDFVSKLNLLLGVIEDPAFERRYCEPPMVSAEQLAGREEAQRIRAENIYLSKVHAARLAMERGELQIAELLRAEAAAAFEKVTRLNQQAGLGVDEILTRADAMLAALFPAASPASETSSPALSPQ